MGRKSTTRNRSAVAEDEAEALRSWVDFGQALDLPGRLRRRLHASYLWTHLQH